MQQSKFINIYRNLCKVDTKIERKFNDSSNQVHFATCFVKLLSLPSDLRHLGQRNFFRWNPLR